MPFLYVHRLVAKCVSKRANSFENKEKKGKIGYSLSYYNSEMDSQNGRSEERRIFDCFVPFLSSIVIYTKQA
jgi:hypothetical protein